MKFLKLVSITLVLALFGLACSAEASLTVESGQGTTDDAVVDEVETEPTVEPTEVAVAEPTPEPEPTEVPGEEPTVEPTVEASSNTIEQDLVEEVIEVMEIAPEYAECTVATVLDEVSITEAQAIFDFDGFTDEQIPTIANALVSCDTASVITQEFLESAELPTDDQTVACVDDALQSGRALEGMLIVGASDGVDPSSLPQEVRDDLTAVFTECVSYGAQVGAALESEGFEMTPEIVSCLDDGGETVLADIYIANGPDADFDELNTAQSAVVIDSMVGCVGFGSFLQIGAEGDGESLEQASIDCLNEEGDDLLRFFLGQEFFDLPDAGGPPATLLGALDTCLTETDKALLGA